ncbi:MAG: histidine--tRNA ligase [Nanoarchaeota archaeon]
MELNRAKGTRDFLPEEKILRQEVESTIRRTFERYGFSPMETPTLERFDVLSAKFAGGEEILKETFKLEDQGKRELGLRYDLTVPLTRVIAMNQQLRLPFKRYQIGSVFRDGPLKLGRYREFVQCDIDTVGVPSIKAEAEVLSVAKDIFAALNVPIKIRVNNRKILDGLMKKAKIKDEQQESIILVLDKLEKLGLDVVKTELKQKGVGEATSKELISWITMHGSNKEKIEKLKAVLKENEGIREIEELLVYIPEVEIDVSLARGFVYYTGTFMEVYAQESAVKSSLAGGGRYDKLIGRFTNEKEFPAVGISFGLDVMCDVLQEQNREKKETYTRVFIIPIKTFQQSWQVAQELRKAGINTEIDLLEKSVGKNLEYVNKKKIPFAIFIGEEELKKKCVKLRDMKSGEETLATIAEIVKKIKK